MGELETLSKPIKEYLEAHYHPHAAIVITSDRVAVVETTLSIPMGLPDSPIGVDFIQPG